jgi:16S rRNA C967 or C1407 C5-methylase (RsmB/RsmF family)
MSVKIVKSIKADARFKDFLKVTEENDNKNEIKYSNDYHNYFDKIFIDSPCSSFGTISKNPDAKYSKNIDKLSSYKQNSLQMLENAGLYLKKGGRIIFYTCTLSKVENEDVINDFIKMNKGAFVIDNTVSVKKLIKDNIKDFPELKNLSAAENIIEIMPYHLNSEAASICSLVKIK